MTQDFLPVSRVNGVTFRLRMSSEPHLAAESEIPFTGVPNLLHSGFRRAGVPSFSNGVVGGVEETVNYRNCTYKKAPIDLTAREWIDILDYVPRLCPKTMSENMG